LLEPPSRYFVEVLSYFVEDPIKKEKLKEFISKDAVIILILFISYRMGNLSFIDIVSERREQCLNSYGTLTNNKSYL
jgi:hypothetical protein